MSDKKKPVYHLPASSKSGRGPIPYTVGFVNRERKQVAIDIEAEPFNCRFIFTEQNDGAVVILDSKHRVVIDPEKSSKKGLTQEMYPELRKRVRAILKGH